MAVKIYTTNHCPYCTMAKEFFKTHNIKYEEVNVEQDEKAAEEMIERSGQMGVPVIEIDGKIIIGFDKRAIEAALKIKS
jgi:glutaredoxin 3